MHQWAPLISAPGWVKPMRGTGGRLDGTETSWACVPWLPLPARPQFGSGCVSLLKATIPAGWCSPTAQVPFSQSLPHLAPLALGVVKLLLAPGCSANPVSSFKPAHSFVNNAFIQPSPIILLESISARSLTKRVPLSSRQRDNYKALLFSVFSPRPKF